jgi:hypothetical protein
MCLDLGEVILHALVIVCDARVVCMRCAVCIVCNDQPGDVWVEVHAAGGAGTGANGHGKQGEQECTARAAQEQEVLRLTECGCCGEEF